MNWKTPFTVLLPAFTESKRDLPRDMLYVAPDRPSWPTTLSVGLQHALVALMFVIYSVIAGEAIGLTAERLRDFVAIGILIIGFGTLLNGLKTRISAGHLLVNIPDPLTLGLFIAIASTFGPRAAAGGMIVLAAVIVLLGRFLPLLRAWLPAEISGIALLLLGVSLIGPGIERAAGLTPLSTGIDPGLDLDGVLVAAATLATMVGLSVWSTGRLRLMAMLVGTGVGLMVAVLVGAFGADELGKVAVEPLFAVPAAHYQPLLPDWQLGAVVPFVLISFVLVIDSVGCGMTIEKMNQANWQRPDFRMIGRMFYGLGLCNLLSGLTGTLGIALSTANLGLAHMTGVAARRVAVIAGLLLMSLAFLPQVTTFMTLMPRAVVGAILLYTAAYMIVSGAELILSRLLDARRRATVGLSLVAGMAVFAVPELTSLLPPQLAPLLGSSLMVGTLSGVLLTMLFRLGAARSSEILLTGPHPEQAAAQHLEDQGARWGGRRDVFQRAVLAVSESLEALEEAGVMTGAPLLRARFDETRLRITLDYPGTPIDFRSDPRLDLHALLNEDADERAIDDAMKAVALSVIRNLADHVELSTHDGRTEIRLRFAH